VGDPGAGVDVVGVGMESGYVTTLAATTLHA
jgi:hypothetical protein